MRKVTWEIEYVDNDGDQKSHYLKNVPFTVKSTEVVDFFNRKFDGLVSEVLSVESVLIAK